VTVETVRICSVSKTGIATRDLTEGSVSRLLLSFSFPILVSNLLSAGYNLADMAIVGRFLGSVGLSAVSIGSDIMHVLLLASNGMSNAAQIIIAQYMGVKDRKAVNKSVGTIFSAVVLFSLALTLLMVGISIPVLRALNTPAEAWTDAVRYSVTCYFGILFTFGYGVLSAILRGMGDSRHPTLFIAVSSVSNLVLDLLFVGALGFGAFGAALATVMGQGLSFLWSLGFVYRRREQFGLDIDREMFRPDREILKKYIHLAIPMFLQKTLIQMANLYVNSFVYAYGVTVTAVTGVGNKLGTLAQVFSNAMLMGGAAIVGQNISAGKTDRVKRVVYINMVYALVVWSAVSALTILFRLQIFGIFTSDALVLEMSAAFLPALIVRYLMFCTRCPFMALINGIGKPRINYILGIVDGLVLRVGVSLLLGLALGLGVQGFWFGNALGGFGPLFVGSVYFFTGRWKNDALITARKEKNSYGESHS